MKLLECKYGCCLAVFSFSFTKLEVFIVKGASFRPSVYKLVYV